jgi:hypothetical protein
MISFKSLGGEIMPRKRLSVRRIKQVLRLKWEAGLDNRPIAKAYCMRRGTVREYLHRAEAAGLCWEQILAGLITYLRAPFIMPMSTARESARKGSDKGGTEFKTSSVRHRCRRRDPSSKSDKQKSSKMQEPNRNLLMLNGICIPTSYDLSYICLSWKACLL